MDRLLFDPAPEAPPVAAQDGGVHCFLMEFDPGRTATATETLDLGDRRVTRYLNEFWTARQRQASSLQEISYRACFKPQLPRFFINLMTGEDDPVYDPFSGRGTTVIEAALLGRRFIANDANPLSRILTAPRLFPPRLSEIEARLAQVPFIDKKADQDLSMFFHPRTEAEIVSLKDYLIERQAAGDEDELDRWMRLVATNRLTGHSRGFFSVYTLPPNQAVSPERQKKINARLGQEPEYRDVRKIILKKTRSLLKDLTPADRESLARAGRTGVFLTNDASATPEIPSNSVQLIVTSPPFLNVVQYTQDNWLRCWFNNLDSEAIADRITCSSSLKDWTAVMARAFQEFHRVIRPGGWVAFEVGEIQGGRLSLDEQVIPLGQAAGFSCRGVVVNCQTFTKTSNIWGVNNNQRGTNTNRIVLFEK
ncbi:MAG: DNA methyltransferase [Thermodesulfobacteriota bacterium]